MSAVDDLDAEVRRQHPPPAQMVCGTCGHWVPQSEPFGECRADPPTAYRYATGAASHVFPCTDKDIWCDTYVSLDGRWQRRIGQREVVKR